MSTRAATFRAEVVRRTPLSEHLVRLELGGPGLAGFCSTEVPDEWVGLVVPGQFQSRFYTVRSWERGVLTLDVVVHDAGLVTEWARGDCVGETCTVTEPQGSFVLPPGAEWLVLAGDLTAVPAMARIVASTRVPTRVWAEAPEVVADYLGAADVTWLDQPGDGRSRLAEVVEAIAWPPGDGFFWMAGESAQMRAIRKSLALGRRLPTGSFQLTGYWRGVAARRPRSVDPRRAS